MRSLSCLLFAFYLKAPFIAFTKSVKLVCLFYPISMSLFDMFILRCNCISSLASNVAIVQELFLNPAKQGLRARRIDWLLHVLLGSVCSHYMHAEHAINAGRGYNKAMEEQLRKTVSNAQQEFAIEMPAAIGEAVKIRSLSSDTAYMYIVTRPGTPEAGCNCIFFMRGNVCKHIIKVSFLSRLKYAPSCPTSCEIL